MNTDNLNPLMASIIESHANIQKSDSRTDELLKELDEKGVISNSREIGKRRKVLRDNDLNSKN